MKLAVSLLIVTTAVAVAAPFHGDPEMWGGVPPVPKEATPTQQRDTDVRCTVADAAGNVVQVWMPRPTCMRWVEDAQWLSKGGPKPSEVWGARVSACARRLAAANMQSRSGEFYSYCARNMPLP